jgi:hypothetical protein
MTFDFSKPETQALYEAEVRKRVELFGMSRCRSRCRSDEGVRR